MPAAHTGKTFTAYLAEPLEVELYNPDKSHPSALGSEFAVRTLPKTILEAW